MFQRSCAESVSEELSRSQFEERNQNVEAKGDKDCCALVGGTVDESLMEFTF